ncbi:MAG: DUF916 domain-containing protein [Candidatus Saccharibacteria bacterium]
MKIALRSLQISTFAIMSALLLVSGAFAQDGGVGGRPANPIPDNVRSKSIFVYTLDKGATKSDEVFVSNNSNDTKTISLYTTDAILTNTGALTCKQQVETNTVVGSWVTLEKQQITLAPGESQKVPFTVKVPATADVGEHNGCVVIQPQEDEAQIEGGVRIRTRSAVRAAVTIPGDLKRDISIKKLSVTSTEVSQTFTLSLQNIGNVSADSINKVHLKSLFGQTAYENGGEYPIVAGSVMDLTFVNENPPFWGGWYYASATATYDKRAGTFGTTSTGNLITKESDRQLIFVMPNIAALFLMAMFILILLAAVVYLTYLRDQRKLTLNYSKKHIVVAGDTLKQVAKNYEVDWKEIAKINRLKPPYDLTSGNVLYVPRLKSKTYAREKTTKSSKT